MSLWLRMHWQALGDALRRLAAQPWASAVSIAVLGMAIALPVLAAVALRSVAALTSGLDTDPHVNIYLALDASDDDVKRIGAALRAHPDVASVRFIPRAEALAELKSTTHLAELLESLDKNPLPHAFTVRVRTTDPERIRAATAAWSQLPKVDQVAADFEWSQRLAHWIRFGNEALLAAALLLAVAVLFIVGHLIRLQVLTRREEVEVSQLVGATAADVRRPFLYHGALEGLLAGLAALGLAGLAALWIGAELSALTPGYAADLKVIFLDLRQCLAIAAGAAALGFVGAWNAVARELRKFSANR
jgi:cell division transport system permease protein